MTDEIETKPKKKIPKWLLVTGGILLLIIIVAIGGGGGKKEVKPEITQPSKEALQEQQISLQEQEIGLSEEKRKEIFIEIVKAEDRALKEAQKKYPLPYYEHLQVGQTYQLSKETPLMPELEPADPFAALQEMKYIPAGGTIEILQVTTKRGNPWYYVNAGGIGRGWINSIALTGQFEQQETQQLDKQLELEATLREKYKDEIAEKYGITDKELLQIMVEGVKKNWK